MDRTPIGGFPGRRKGRFESAAPAGVAAIASAVVLVAAVVNLVRRRPAAGRAPEPAAQRAP